MSFCYYVCFVLAQMIPIFTTNLSFLLTLQAGYVGEDVESILYKLLMVCFIELCITQKE